ncbi:MAG: MerR family transcriptional regulator [Candidatus Omnitrophica bacterium]|nr:MerR family transcriptional regulator [Candidatus Omnitrophota bacterium]
MNGNRDMQRQENFEEFYIHPDEPVFTSGVVCRLLEIPVWVLKQLDAENIVKPHRQEGCSRLYSKRELKKLERIWHYMNVKQVKIKGVKVILEMEMKIERLEGKG